MKATERTAGVCRGLSTGADKEGCGAADAHIQLLQDARVQRHHDPQHHRGGCVRAPQGQAGLSAQITRRHAPHRSPSSPQAFP